MGPLSYGARHEMDSQEKQQLEDRIALLSQKLSELSGTDQELGVLTSLGYGMTGRLAFILSVLVKRSPAIISRQTLHSLVYSDREDGGPEPRILAVHIFRLRGILKRLGCPGKITTTWNSGYQASPELVSWVKDLYQKNIT